MEDKEEMIMEQIGELVKQGYYSGILGDGTTWALEVNFEDDSKEPIYKCINKESCEVEVSFRNANDAVLYCEAHGGEEKMMIQKDRR